MSSLTLGGLQIDIQGGPNAYHSVHTRNDDWICCGPDGLLPIDSLVLSSYSDDGFGNDVSFALAFNDTTAVGLESTELPNANTPMFSLPLSEVADAWFDYSWDDHHFSAGLTVDNLHVYAGGADIAPVPLPSAALLALFGPLALFGIKRRASR